MVPLAWYLILSAVLFSIGLPFIAVGVLFGLCVAGRGAPFG